MFVCLFKYFLHLSNKLDISELSENLSKDDLEADVNGPIYGVVINW